MDRATEPVLVVLGHPIAGNPAQFAMERALAAMKLDWRVLSFDVLPSRLHVALEGLDALGVEGVLFAPNLLRAAAQWAVTQTLDSASPLSADGSDPPVAQPFDFLARARSTSDGKVARTSGSSTWSAEHGAARWLAQTVEDHFARLGRSLEGWLSIGSDVEQTLLTTGDLKRLYPERFPSLPRPNASESDGVSLVLVGDIATDAATIEEASAMIDLEDPNRLVVDLIRPASDSPFNSGTVRLLGVDDLQSGMLAYCLRTWTQQAPPMDILREAIEEYSAL